MSNIVNYSALSSLLRRFIHRLQMNRNARCESPASASPALASKAVTRFENTIPTLPIDRERKLIISFVVIVYKMPEQAKKTIFSLSPQYQRGISADDYEIIVVENKSDRLLGEAAALAQSANVRYFLRDEKLPTPVFAINFGASQARGTHIAVMIDGARMCSPGVVNYMLTAARLAPSVAIAVPGYHLGYELQQKSILKGYNESVEAALLDSIEWPSDGYRLFEIACLSGTCAGGVFKPIGESNCIAVPRTIFFSLGGFDTHFVGNGGGFVNLDFYKRVVEHPEIQLIVLLGEGSFHQVHGGATTGSNGAEREESMQALAQEYQALRNETYSPPAKRPIFLGAISDASLKFIRHGANVAAHLDEC